MKYITLPTSEVRRLSFYLAMEEYVARHLDKQDSFFLWQMSITAGLMASGSIGARVGEAVCMPTWIT